MFYKDKFLPFPPLPEGEGTVALMQSKAGEWHNLQLNLDRINKNHRLYGTLNRPKNDIGQGWNFLTIKEQEAAFSISDLKLEKTDGLETVTGLVKVLKTPHGEILDKMLAKGIALSIAPRVHLMVDSIPGESGLRIITWDVVSGEKK